MGFALLIGFAVGFVMAAAAYEHTFGSPSDPKQTGWPTEKSLSAIAGGVAGALLVSVAGGKRESSYDYNTRYETPVNWAATPARTERATYQPTTYQPTWTTNNWEEPATTQARSRWNTSTTDWTTQNRSLPQPIGGDVYVRGYQRNDGTYVQPHYRTSPDGNPWNNYSTAGNVNPYTGKRGIRHYP